MSVAVFPDGRRVVSGSYDETVKVWDAATGECVATLDGSDVNETKTFRVDRPNYFLHTLNAFWNGTTVVVDCTVASKDPFKGPNVRLDVMRNKTLRDRAVNTDANMRVDRFRLFEDGTVAQETLSAPGRSTDFTKINFEYAAHDYCYYYGIEWGHDLESYGSMAVVKQDLCAGAATHWHRPGWFPGEASFVPTGGTNEDDGVLVFVALHGANRTSSFVVADATDCADVVADGAAALVVDKSTLDCLLCSDAAAYACSVARMLAVGGCFLVMSFHDAEFLKAALCAALPFRVEREVVREKNVALLLRRTAGAWEPEAVAAALLRPTVPPERLARLRASWGGARPLREAYDLLFSDALKAEYAFADFEADAGSADRWSLDDALAFLRRTQ